MGIIFGIQLEGINILFLFGVALCLIIARASTLVLRGFRRDPL